MSLYSRLQPKVDSRMNQFQVTSRPVYKRLVTRVGGDQLIGRPGSVTRTDTLLSPTPVVQFMDSTSITQSNRNPIVVVGSERVAAGDYVVYISSSAITETELLNKDVLIVFKGNTPEDERNIAAYDPIVVNGMILTFVVLLRSKTRT